MAMVEATTFFEVINLEQIDQKRMQEFLSKNSVWDFYEMGGQEYLSKSNEEKYYNEMVKGKIYISSLFLFLISFSISSKFESILSAIVSLIIFFSDDLISLVRQFVQSQFVQNHCLRNQVMLFQSIHLIHCL